MSGAGLGGAAENARMLAALIGVDEEEAAERLQRCVLITAASSSQLAAWAAEIAALIDRTIIVTDDPAEADVELVLGALEPRSQAKCIYADIAADQAKVASVPVSCSGSPPHPLFGAIAACAVAAAVIHAAVGDVRLPDVPDPLTVKYSDIGLPDLGDLTPIDLTGAVLVGAGAVAHGFLRALRHIPVRGELDVLDPKKVGSGNPNRCLYLTESDLGEFKAEALAKNAAGAFPALELKPRVAEFKNYAAERENVPLAIVTIDSRRARRSLQKFIPGRVLDASTTDGPRGGSC